MKKGNLIPEILICTLISYRQRAIWLRGNDTLSTLGEVRANLTAEHVWISRVIKGFLLAFMTFLQPTNAILNVLSLRNNCKTSGVFQLMEGRPNHIRFWNATLNPCNQQNHLNSHPSSAGSNIVIRDNQISLCKFRLMVRMEAVNSAILNSDFLSLLYVFLCWCSIF